MLLRPKGLARHDHDVRLVQQPGAPLIPSFGMSGRNTVHRRRVSMLITSLCAGKKSYTLFQIVLIECESTRRYVTPALASFAFDSRMRPIPDPTF